MIFVKPNVLLTVPVPEEVEAYIRQFCNVRKFDYKKESREQLLQEVRFRLEGRFLDRMNQRYQTRFQTVKDSIHLFHR